MIIKWNQDRYEQNMQVPGIKLRAEAMSAVEYLEMMQTETNCWRTYQRCMTKTMSLSAMDAELGGISISAISQNKKRLGEKTLKDKGLTKRFVAIEKN